MVRVKRKSLIIYVCFLLGLFSISIYYLHKSGEQILEKWETSWGGNKILVTAYAEQNNYVPGAYYDFEIVDKLNKRNKIMTFRHDDPVPINKNGVVFLNDNVAYIFMGWKYAVTIDGGRTWSVWDAETSLTDWKCCNYFLIKNIELKKDGKGKMFLSNANNETANILETIDYGQTWFLSN